MHSDTRHRVIDQPGERLGEYVLRSSVTRYYRLLLGADESGPLAGGELIDKQGAHSVEEDS